MVCTQCTWCPVASVMSGKAVGRHVGPGGKQVMRTFPAQHMQVPALYYTSRKFFSFEVAVTIKRDASICYRISAHIYTHLNPGPAYPR